MNENRAALFRCLVGLQGEGRKLGGEVIAALHIVQAAPDGIVGVGKRVFPRRSLGGAGQEPVVGRIKIAAVIGDVCSLAAIRDAIIVLNPKVSQFSGGEDIGGENLGQTGR